MKGTPLGKQTAYSLPLHETGEGMGPLRNKSPPFQKKPTWPWLKTRCVQLHWAERERKRGRREGGRGCGWKYGELRREGQLHNSRLFCCKRVKEQYVGLLMVEQQALPSQVHQDSAFSPSQRNYGAQSQQARLTTACERYCVEILKQTVHIAVDLELSQHTHIPKSEWVPELS